MPTPPPRPTLVDVDSPPTNNFKRVAEPTEEASKTESRYWRLRAQSFSQRRQQSRLSLTKLSKILWSCWAKALIRPSDRPTFSTMEHHILFILEGWMLSCGEVAALKAAARQTAA
ncbi:hypothetical protein VNO80_23041 [Phaseolus coccineus]|uniref:Uncharacterized protein n=1 Tax=Phaseolus coccineus TaxID=3886 RepID=A0AAN9QZC9_PHACN